MYISVFKFIQVMSEWVSLKSFEYMNSNPCCSIVQPLGGAAEQGNIESSLSVCHLKYISITANSLSVKSKVLTHKNKGKEQNPNNKDYKACI